MTFNDAKPACDRIVGLVKDEERMGRILKKACQHVHGVNVAAVEERSS